MPEYLYKNPQTGEVKGVIQTMREEHVFVDEEGLEWKRVYTSPNASIDSLSNTDPFDTRAHTEKTGKMKGTMGDLFSISKEMSERRQDKIGAEDPIKRKFFNDYKEKNNGTKHFHDRPDKIETKNAIIDFKATPKKFKES